jgi:hypothetical protein
MVFETKRDRRSISLQSSTSLRQTRKSKAVHVSLSPDIIVKQQDRPGTQRQSANPKTRQHSALGNPAVNQPNHKQAKYHRARCLNAGSAAVDGRI